MIRTLITRCEHDLLRDGEVVVTDPVVAELLYDSVKDAGNRGISLSLAYVLRTHQEAPMLRDRFMLFLLFAGVLLTLGILLGHWATTVVNHETAAMIASEIVR